jgi:hypothetical protein
MPLNLVHANWIQFIWKVLIFFLISWGGVRLSPLGMSANIWPIVPAPGDRWWLWSSRQNENWQEKPKYSEKTCPSATSSATDPTWPDLGSIPGRRGGKPATNRLSYDTAWKVLFYVYYRSADFSTHYNALYSRRQNSLQPPLWEPDIPQGQYIHMNVMYSSDMTEDLLPAKCHLKCVHGLLGRTSCHLKSHPQPHNYIMDGKTGTTSTGHGHTQHNMYPSYWATPHRYPYII